MKNDPFKNIYTLARSLADKESLEELDLFYEYAGEYDSAYMTMIAIVKNSCTNISEQTYQDFKSVGQEFYDAHLLEEGKVWEELLPLITK